MRAKDYLRSIEPDRIDSTLDRLKWREQLTDDNCRSLMSEYLRGEREEYHIDAKAEYEHRWGPYVKGEGFDKRPSGRVKYKKRNKRA